MSAVAVLALGLAVHAADVQPKARREAKAKQVASAWFQSLMQGDTAVTTALSDVPFAMDRKQTIESIAELEKMLESVLEKKGKRDIKPTAIKIAVDQNQIQKDAFPANFIVVHLVIDGDDEVIALCVKPGDTYKIVGLSD
jgi:hypothetical protein